MSSAFGLLYLHIYIMLMFLSVSQSVMMKETINISQQPRHNYPLLSVYSSTLRCESYLQGYGECGVVQIMQIVVCRSVDNIDSVVQIMQIMLCRYNASHFIIQFILAIICSMIMKVSPRCQKILFFPTNDPRV